MAVPANSITPLSTVLFEILALCAQTKAQAQSALTFMVSNNIDSNYAFSVIDQINNFTTAIAAWGTTSGLNAFATAQLPNYAGTLTTDLTTCYNAARAVVTWITANFPVDSSGYIQSYKFNADGTRAANSFTPAQTAGLQSALQAFINTVS